MFIVHIKHKINFTYIWNRICINKWYSTP